jgi:hypothetical protein
MHAPQERYDMDSMDNFRERGEALAQPMAPWQTTNTKQSGSVADLHFIGLDPQAEFISIDEQSEDNVMHLDRSRKADRLAHQTFDPGA